MSLIINSSSSEIPSEIWVIVIKEINKLDLWRLEGVSKIFKSYVQEQYVTYCQENGFVVSNEQEFSLRNVIFLDTIHEHVPSLIKTSVSPILDHVLKDKPIPYLKGAYTAQISLSFEDSNDLEPHKTVVFSLLTNDVQRQNQSICRWTFTKGEVETGENMNNGKRITLKVSEQEKTLSQIAQCVNTISSWRVSG